ncbi:penicillin-binding protein 1A [Occallatibacter riparius]|uniref:PBP1A family penicillin-binding protein n=1 Tax=Occallatibacter riparius TaxID=1002689 RepID=A0A9J7BU52_9BACT|nr:PBP1A family penicillin-binding protein [Occallatibacter riparius]UWZ86168.1 PBP1A family penicillin-binding protein [Occallatibacter riparius]
MATPIQYVEEPQTLGRSHRREPDPEDKPVKAPKKPRAQKPRRKLAGKAALAILIVLSVVTGSLAGLTLVYSSDLPQIEDLERYRPSTTTDLYDQKGRVIGAFALQRRIVVNYNDFAPILRKAVVSIEDKDFESHGGINFWRIWGAAWHDIRSKGRAQGASTLTMQLARNLFFSADLARSVSGMRKIQEAFLAIQIERTFTKEQIFTLYGNQIYLGSGMYGFEAASQFYFGAHAKDLTLTQAALLAGLPKGPYAYSPILNPEKALKRRNLVISEMESDGLITHAEAGAARGTGLGLKLTQPEGSVAPWFQEEVRRELEKQFGSEQVHESGLRVDTTLDLDLQKTANQAVLDGVATYERRHGWNGKLDNVIADGNDMESYKHPDWALKYSPGDYVHAVVTSVLPTMVRARIGSEEVFMQPADWQWTGQRYADALLKPGDVIYVHLQDGFEGGGRKATLEQDSGAQGALMMMDNTTGDVLAMVGGRDYSVSVFNRATQAERQTGSSFKPYVYTTAVEDGVKPDDVIVDGPVSFGSYTPHNYENDYKGAMTITNAFAESRNIPALKLAARVGIHKVIDMAHRFGVTSNIPAYLPVALGAAEITLEEQVASYSVFPNDGIRVQPRLIRKVSNADGITLWEDPPQVKEVISQQTARTMMTLLRAVTAHGTGAAASQLNHPLGGKTGTTSDYTDAWFLGFSPSVTCGVWVGFDSRESLGEKETGAKAALPIWMAVMKQAIVGKDNEKFLGDQGEQKAPLLQASAAGAAAPVKTGARPSMSKPAAMAGAAAAPRPPVAGSGAKTVTAVPAQGAPKTVNAAPSTKPGVVPAPRPPAGGPAVRQALPAASVPAKAKPAVKPALHPGR